MICAPIWRVVCPVAHASHWVRIGPVWAEPPWARFLRAGGVVAKPRHGTGHVCVLRLAAHRRKTSPRTARRFAEVPKVFSLALHCTSVAAQYCSATYFGMALTCSTKFTKPSAPLWSPLQILHKLPPSCYSNPLSPFGVDSFFQRLSAGYDLLYRLGKDYEKPEFGIRTVRVGEVEVAIHERVEINKPFVSLRRFQAFFRRSRYVERPLSASLWC